MTSLPLPYWMEEMVAEPSPSSPTASAAPASLHAEEFMLFDDNFAAGKLLATFTQFAHLLCLRSFVVFLVRNIVSPGDSNLEPRD